MAEQRTLPKDRLRPVLLDRLTDDEPEKQVESRQVRALTVQRLREAVLRDLGWLFNTTNLESAQNLEEYPQVKSSVVNYGLPELTGITASSLVVRELERQVDEAIRQFEPRVIGQSLRVRIRPPKDGGSPNGLVFEISGELFAEPLPERLFLRTQVDLDMGHFEVLSDQDRG